MAANLIPLDDILNGIDLLDNRMAYGHHLTKTKKRFLALEGLRELNLDVARSIKGKKLLVASNGTITMPTDYMDYAGLYVVDVNNVLLPLGFNRFINISNEPLLDHNSVALLDHNGEMLYASKDKTDTKSITGIIGSDGEINQAHQFNRNYGIGGGHNENGVYRWDNEANTFQFDGEMTDKYIYLEYISNGLTGVKAQLIQIPVQVIECMKAFIMWKSVLYQRGISALEKRELRANFYMEKRKAFTRMTKFIIEEAKQSSRIWTQQTARY